MSETVAGNTKKTTLELVVNGSIEVTNTTPDGAASENVDHNLGFKPIAEVFVLFPSQASLPASTQQFLKVNAFFFGGVTDYVNAYYWVTDTYIQFNVDLGAGVDSSSLGTYVFKYYIYRLKAE